MRKSTLLWILAVCIASAMSAGLGAQALQSQFDQPRILSGDDLGFRVEGQRRESRTDHQTGRTAPVNVLTGRLMVRVNGQWVAGHYVPTYTGYYQPAWVDGYYAAC